MNLLNKVEVPKEESKSSNINLATITAQFRIVKGDAYLEGRNRVQASNIYRENIDAFDKGQEGEIADLAAVSKLRLSNCDLTQGDVKREHTLINEVIAHFEEQDSKRGQAQYARALYHQALMYEEQGKEKFQNRSMASARRALEEIYKEHGLAVPASNCQLGKNDFDTLIELGFV